MTVGGAAFRVETTAVSDTEVERVFAVVAVSGLLLSESDSVARSFIGFVSTIRYVGAETSAARTWAEAHATGAPAAVRNFGAAEFSTGKTVIGNVPYYGLEIRSLGLVTAHAQLNAPSTEATRPSSPPIAAPAAATPRTSAAPASTSTAQPTTAPIAAASPVSTAVAIPSVTPTQIPTPIRTIVPTPTATPVPLPTASPAPTPTQVPIYVSNHVGCLSTVGAIQDFPLASPGSTSLTAGGPITAALFTSTTPKSNFRLALYVDARELLSVAGTEVIRYQAPSAGQYFVRVAAVTGGGCINLQVTSP